MFEKLRYPISTGCFNEKPFRTVYYIIRIILSDYFKLKINYEANINKSRFFYNYKPYSKSGLGGRGQYILREYYDKFFSVGKKYSTAKI